jgi:hypothetical protein
MRTLWTTVGALALAFLGWGLWLEFDQPANDPSASPPTNPADARQQEILKQSLAKPGDPELGNTFQDINARHFAGSLPRIPVVWESRLAEVGSLAARQFTLEGMFGHVGKQAIILLNPDLRQDRAKLVSSLCHEMVHAYLFTVGDNSTNHGPAFQDVLRRLSAEGAFEGIRASDDEKAGLRAWLDAESVRIDRERSEMDQLSGDIERERAEVDRELADLNARITAANAAGRGWPASGEVDAVTSRRDLYNQHATDANARIERDRADLAEFNLRVNRYNLMVSYPDGLDEESIVKPKPAMPRQSGG